MSRFDKMCERDIVRDAKAGDLDAIKELWARYYPMVRKHRYRMERIAGNKKDIGDDFEQDAFEGLLSAIDGARLVGLDTRWKMMLLMSWELQIIRNRYVRDFNRRSKKEEMEQDYNDLFQENAASESEDGEIASLNAGYNLCSRNGESIFDRYRNTETQAHNLIEKEDHFYKSLNAEQLNIIQQRKEGKTLAEIARLMGHSYSWVQTRVATMKKQAEAIFEIYV